MCESTAHILLLSYTSTSEKKSALYRLCTSIYIYVDLSAASWGSAADQQGVRAMDGRGHKQSTDWQIADLRRRVSALEATDEHVLRYRWFQAIECSIALSPPGMATLM